MSFVGWTWKQNQPTFQFIESYIMHISDFDKVKELVWERQNLDKVYRTLSENKDFTFGIQIHNHGKTLINTIIPIDKSVIAIASVKRIQEIDAILEDLGVNV